jgi:prolyl-tRNA synthetase
MKQSQIFSKTRHDAPKDEVSKNAVLLIRAGFIHKEMAGVYSILPLGLRVLKKIENIIREEMDKIGGNEISMTALQEKGVWEKTGRWDDKVVDNWFKTSLKNGTELGLAYTHEAVLADLMKTFISSYRDLPSYPYQFQTKFRNELRAKSGILRGREFLMKDLYSFSKTTEELDEFYEKSIVAYKKVFERVGIGHITYLTLASGGSFGTKYSHEFQTLTPAGEDTIYIHKEKNIAINKEVLNDEALAKLEVSEDDLVPEKSIEVGNIYKLGTFYSEPLELSYKNEKGEKVPVVMGSYGIGIGRLMGTVVEVNGEKDAMFWPEEIAPFRVHLIGIANDDELIKSQIEEIYKKISNANIEVLYDDREMRVGEKFGDADLIGIPHRLVVSKKTLEKNEIEYENRITKEKENLTLEKVIKMFSERNLPAKNL